MLFLKNTEVKLMLKNIKNRIDARRHDGELDSGDIVQTVLLIAGFAIIAIIVVGWLGSAMLNKAADASACIEGANTYSSSGTDEQASACEEGDNSVGSYKDNESYQSRSTGGGNG